MQNLSSFVVFFFPNMRIQICTEKCASSQSRTFLCKCLYQVNCVFTASWNKVLMAHLIVEMHSLRKLLADETMAKNLQQVNGIKLNSFTCAKNAFARKFCTLNVLTCNIHVIIRQFVMASLLCIYFARVYFHTLRFFLWPDNGVITPSHYIFLHRSIISFIIISVQVF